MNELEILQRIDNPNYEERNRISELKTLKMKRDVIGVLHRKKEKKVYPTIKEQFKHIENSFLK